MSGKDNFNEYEWPIETYCKGSMDQLKRRQFPLTMFALSPVIKEKAKLEQGTCLWRGFKCTEQKKTQNQNTIFVFRMMQFEACHRNKVHIT